jgi:4'-phosphopantetheinyl transferase
LVNLLVTRIPKFIPKVDFNRLLDTMPLIMQEEILKYKKEEDQLTRLFSKILLATAIQKHASNDFSIFNLKYDSESRPFIAEEIDFNISHSGNWVGCCFTVGHRVGLDIEKIQPINLGDFSELIHESEYLKISSSKDKAVAFFQYWTRLEAVLKADGRGLKIPLKHVVFNDDFSCFLSGKDWFTYPLNIDDGYVCHIAIDRILAKPVIVEMYDFKDLLEFFDSKV